MARVAITLSFVDGKGEQSTTTLYSTDTLPLAALLEGVGTLVTLVKGVTGGGITRAALCVELALTSSEQAVDDASLDVEEGAILLQRTDGGFERRNRIPTIIESKFVNDTRELDTSDVDVAALISALTTGISTASGDLIFTDDRGDEVVSVYDAYESFQSSRRRR